MQTHANTLSAQSFLSKKQISSVEMWKFRIEKHMGVRAGRCMRTMSRPRHVRRRQHKHQHLASTSLHSCSTFSRCPHTKRCTQLVASSATWHLHARHTLIQTNNHTGIHACSKQLPNNKSTNQDGDRQRRSELPYHTSRQEHKKTPRTWVLQRPCPRAGDAS
jgi:hypothetical protein